MIQFYVYMFLDHDTGQPVYIGKGSKKRDSTHKGNARVGCQGRLYDWMRNYHVRNGAWPIPFRYAEGLNEQEAFELEKKVIAYYGRRDMKTGCLFNLTDGGEGWGKSPETIAKISESKKGMKLRPESIAKRTASVLGRKNSSETILKMQIAQKGKKMSPEARAKISAAVRARPPQSAETLAKISMANAGKPSWNKGQITPDDVKAKMSAAHKGKIYTAEQIAHYSAAAAIREAKKRMQLKVAA